MRRILSGVIEHPHFGQTVLRDAFTFSRLIFCFWGTRDSLTLGEKGISDLCRWDRFAVLAIEVFQKLHEWVPTGWWSTPAGRAPRRRRRRR